jgi:NADH:ubiquinone oxidoreductase subunit 6 (subunit J)
MFDLGGLLGALFAAPPVVLLVVVAVCAAVVRRKLGAVSLGAWLLLLLTTAVACVLLFALLMLDGRDPYGNLIGLWSMVLLPQAALLAGTATVIRLVSRVKDLGRSASATSAEEDRPLRPRQPDDSQ